MDLPATSGLPALGARGQRQPNLAPIQHLLLPKTTDGEKTQSSQKGSSLAPMPGLGPIHGQVPKLQLTKLNNTGGGGAASSSQAKDDPPTQGSSRVQLGKLANTQAAPGPPLPPKEEVQSARTLRSSGGPRETQSRGNPQGSQSSRQNTSSGARPATKERPSKSERQGQRADTNREMVPQTPAKVLKHHMVDLTEFEQGEILDYPQVYFFGAGAPKIRGTSSQTNNHGYDDDRGDYQVVLHDHVLYRYEVMNPLGKGSFGQVVRVHDFKTGEQVALKVIRNKKRFHHQALVEVKILEHLREKDSENTSNVVHMCDYFYFRNHLCITFELLSINLYDFIKNNNFQGVSLGLIRRFAIQLLTALRFLRKQRVIHCDFKPENVLLKNPTKSGIKVIDFGSSCFEDERVYTYIQSRFYRSPEVILGMPYAVAIDMWSFGCILAELYTGYPLFPGENEVEQLLCIMEVQGEPPRTILDAATRKKMFFDSNGNPRIVPNSRGKKRRPGAKDLQMALRTSDVKFVDFLKGCLDWDPKARFTPEDALQHEWILDGYPKYSGAAGSGQERGEHSSKRQGQAQGSGALPPATGASSHMGGGGNQFTGNKQPSAFMFPPIDYAKK